MLGMGTLRILSPVSRKCCRVAMTGRPAPTVACGQAGQAGAHQGGACNRLAARLSQLASLASLTRITLAMESFFVSTDFVTQDI